MLSRKSILDCWAIFSPTRWSKTLSELGYRSKKEKVIDVFVLFFFFFTHDNKENEERRKQTSFFIREEVLNNLQSGFCSKLCCWKHGCEITKERCHNFRRWRQRRKTFGPKFCFVYHVCQTYIGHSEIVCQEITGLFRTNAKILVAPFSSFTNLSLLSIN